MTIPLLLLMTYLINKTRQGKAMRATAQDQDAARLMGIDVDRTIALTFALGGALAGAAGLLYLESVGTTRYDLGFQLGLIAFTSAVLGGIGNLNGAVLGGFLIGIIQALNEAFLLGSAWSQTVVFSILIMLMVFKPEGILGQADHGEGVTMATLPTASAPSVNAAAEHARRSNRLWSIGMLIGALLLFVLYWKILPGIGGETETFFRKWLSVSVASEMVLWVVFALGLNIVVGYAGLLDLGYVAFWAIGGYVAGWIMSPFASEMSESMGPQVQLPRPPAGDRGPGPWHPRQLLAGAAHRRSVLRAVGRADRRADAAPEERLPGPGHPRASARSFRRSSRTVTTSAG